MAAEDIKKHEFTSDNQPRKRRSRKGVPNRSTVLKKWLRARVEITNPITQKVQTVSAEDAIMLALIMQAGRGNVPAIKEILDTLYGKVADKITNADGTPLMAPVANALMKVYAPDATPTE